MKRNDMRLLADAVVRTALAGGFSVEVAIQFAEKSTGLGLLGAKTVAAIAREREHAEID